MQDDANNDHELRELVTRTSSGDPQALRELLVEFVPELHAFCRLNMGEHLMARDTTEDVVQSSCREVLAAIDGGSFEFLGLEHFRRWLFLHVLRKIQGRGRYWAAEKRKREVLSLDAAASFAAYSSMASPSEAAVRREEVERIEKAFHLLSEEQRQVLTMAKFLHMTSEEIGKQLGRPPGTIRVMLHRGVARLAIALDTAE